VQNKKTLFERYSGAAEQGDAEAQFQIGCMYSDRGDVVVQDEKKAFEWLFKVAKQGHPDAQYRYPLLDWQRF
jgi:TPR repeat protein